MAGANHSIDLNELLVLREPEPKPFEQTLAECGLHPLTATGIGVLQVNVGKLCNQTCRHCHVDAGPHRREQMSRQTAEQCIDALRVSTIPTLDLTGGAPELNPNFRFLVEQARALGRHVIDRCNLSVLLLPSQSDLAAFLAAHQVEVVASLPCYTAATTDAQRGEGVFERSIEALKLLNRHGFGHPDTGLTLNLVYNPAGDSLPPPQQPLEDDFRRELSSRYGILFNSLYTITNMPISRFLESLVRSGKYVRYMNKLTAAFQAETAAKVMCRTTLSVGWDGTLYDCDFNQMLEMPVKAEPRHIADFHAAVLGRRAIATGTHCYGCTAGAGSSCTGAIKR